MQIVYIVLIDIHGNSNKVDMVGMQIVNIVYISCYGNI